MNTKQTNDHMTSDDLKYRAIILESFLKLELFNRSLQFRQKSKTLVEICSCVTEKEKYWFRTRLL